MFWDDIYVVNLYWLCFYNKKYFTAYLLCILWLEDFLPLAKVNGDVMHILTSFQQLWVPSMCQALFWALGVEQWTEIASFSWSLPANRVQAVFSSRIFSVIFKAFINLTYEPEMILVPISHAVLLNEIYLDCTGPPVH